MHPWFLQRVNGKPPRNTSKPPIKGKLQVFPAVKWEVLNWSKLMVALRNRRIAGRYIHRNQLQEILQEVRPIPSKINEGFPVEFPVVGFLDTCVCLGGSLTIQHLGRLQPRLHIHLALAQGNLRCRAPGASRYSQIPARSHGFGWLAFFLRSCEGYPLFPPKYLTAIESLDFNFLVEIKLGFPLNPQKVNIFAERSTTTKKI